MKGIVFYLMKDVLIFYWLLEMEVFRLGRFVRWRILDIVQFQKLVQQYIFQHQHFLNIDYIFGHILETWACPGHPRQAEVDFLPTKTLHYGIV